MTMEEIKDNDAALASLFALSRDAVLLLREGRVVSGNEAAARLFGREVAGVTAAELLPEITELPGGTDAVTAAEVDGVVYTVTAVPREDTLVLTLMAPEQALEGVGAALLSRLRAAAFRMRLCLDDLAEEAGEGEAARRTFHSYFEILHRIGQLADAGALARGELPCTMEPAELGQLVWELVDSVSFFASRRQTALTCTVPDTPCLTMADRGRLEELLLILLSNALRHTGPKGHIRVGLRQDAERFILSVDDDGEGMGPRELSYAFALRENAEPGDAAYGAGMGLYIAQGIARLHGGAVVLCSEPGKGTRVRVTLPRARDLGLRDVAPSPIAGPDRILTELADLLPDEMYDGKYLD